MHGFFSETIQEPQSHQIEITVKKTTGPELAFAVFSWLMLYRFFPDLGKTGTFGQNRNVSVHLVIQFDIFHDIFPVCFESTIEIMQFNTRHASRRCIKKSGWQVFGQFGIVTFFFPSRHQIISFFLNHPVQFGNLFGTVLQIGIHRNHHIAFGFLKCALQSRRFPVIATKLYRMYPIRFRL